MTSEKDISSNLTIMFKTWSMITNKPYSAQNEMISNRKVNCFVLKQLRLYLTVALCSSVEIHFFLPVWLIYVLITRIKDPWKTNVRLQGNKKSSNLLSSRIINEITKCIFKMHQQMTLIY